MPLLSLEQESYYSVSLSHDFAPEFSSPRDVIEDVLVFKSYLPLLPNLLSWRKVKNLIVLASSMSIMNFMNQKLCVYRSYVRRKLNPLIWNLMMIFWVWNMNLFLVG